MTKNIWHCPNCKKEIEIPLKIKRTDSRLWCQNNCFNPPFQMIPGTAKEGEATEKRIEAGIKGMAQALGSLGGKATKKKYGKEHYRKLAKNMNKKRWGKAVQCSHVWRGIQCTNPALKGGKCFTHK